MRWVDDFDRPRHPLPLAAFRVVFFAAVALHFLPAAWSYDDNFAPDAVRLGGWNRFLFELAPSLPPGVVHAIAAVTTLAIGGALVGWRVRWTIPAAGLGCYALTSFNAMNVQTLALTPCWAIFLAWSVIGGGDEALAVGARRPPMATSGLLRHLIAAHLMLGLFWAGVEKVLAGWPLQNEMETMLAMPPGTMVRDWAVSVFAGRAGPLGLAFGGLTLLVELGIPLLALRGRLHWTMLVVLVGFFVGIVAVLDVPPLFFALFGLGAPLLLIDDRLLASRFPLATEAPRAPRPAAQVRARAGATS
jgi:hypothetical protein